MAIGPSSKLATTVGGDWKGKASPLLYLVGVAFSFWLPLVAKTVYVGVALMWLVPDRRIENAVSAGED